MKKSTIFFVSLLSVLSLLLTVFSVYIDLKDDDQPSKTDKSTVSVSTREPINTTPVGSGYFYINDNESGYYSIGDMTYMYKRYAIDGSVASAFLEGADYDDYENFWYYSYNGTDWYPVADQLSGDIGLKVTSMGINGNLNKYVYFAYCVIQNCEDQEGTVNFFEKNVFNNSDYYYVSFSSAVGSPGEVMD